MSTDQTSRSLAGLSADLGRSLGLSNGGRLPGPTPRTPAEAQAAAGLSALKAARAARVARVALPEGLAQAAPFRRLNATGEPAPAQAQALPVDVASLLTAFDLNPADLLATPRPVLPGEALPPAPVAWAGPAPELPALA